MSCEENVTFNVVSLLSEELKLWITQHFDPSECVSIVNLCVSLELFDFKHFYDVTTISAAEFEKIALPFAQQKGGGSGGDDLTEIFKSLRAIWLCAEARALGCLKFPKFSGSVPSDVLTPKPNVPQSNRFRLGETALLNSRDRFGWARPIESDCTSSYKSPSVTTKVEVTPNSQETVKYIPRRVYMEGRAGHNGRKKAKLPVVLEGPPIDQSELDFDILFMIQLFSGASEILDDFSAHAFSDGAIREFLLDAFGAFPKGSSAKSGLGFCV